MQNVSRLFAKSAQIASREVGRTWVFFLALISIVVWAATGPIFDYSNTWQLIINTSTSVITFLMVFLIQNAQNRDTAALQVKLDELIRVSAANNTFMGLEHLTNDELEKIKEKIKDREQVVIKARKEKKLI